MSTISDDANIREKQSKKYSWGTKGFITNYMSRRTADSHASFFLPYLQPNMKLLDCGCGPGTITIGLAQAVNPGETVGVDAGENQVEIAQENAESQKVTNLRFEVGSIYELPFEDDYFDAVFSHALLEHLNDPTKALDEMVRVLKPDGIMGARATEASGRLLWPPIEEIQKHWDLVDRIVDYNGGDSGIGKQLRSLLCQSGLRDVEASASYESFGKPGSIEVLVDLVSKMRENPAVHKMIELGWITLNEWDEIVSAYRQWAKTPDAFLEWSWGEAVGWKK